MNPDDRQRRLDDVDRLLREVREELALVRDDNDELRALHALLQVTRAIHSETDIYSLMTLILDSALAFTGAERAFLLLLSPRGEPRLKMGRTGAGQYLNARECSVSSRVVQTALLRHRPIILPDAQGDVPYNKWDSIVKLKLRTIIAAPLRVGEHPIGLLYVDGRRALARYGRHHLSVMTTLAEQAAAALSRAQKFDTYGG